MKDSKPYKYSDIAPDQDVIFLLVIKPLHWTNDPEDDKYGDSIPVGAITWISKSTFAACESKGLKTLVPGISVHPENNRYVSNFDPSCFEILITSKQKIR